MALALRLFHLGTQSLWYDELFNIWMARKPLPELLAQVAAGGQTPPLYDLVVALWDRLSQWGTSKYEWCLATQS